MSLASPNTGTVSVAVRRSTRGSTPTPDDSVSGVGGPGAAFGPILLLTLVVLVATALVLAWLVPHDRSFVAANALSVAGRKRMLVALAIVGSATPCAATLWLWQGPAATSLASLQRWSRFLTPLLPLAIVPSVLAAGGSALQKALLLLVCVLLLEPALCAALASIPDAAQACWRRARRWLPAMLPRSTPIALVLGAAAAYAAFMSFATLSNHERFGTSAFDLGIFDNLFWNTLHGHPLRATPVVRGGDWSFLSNHAPFLTFVLLPFYALAPGPKTLLLLQSVFLAAGAIPVYRLTARHLSRAAACCFALMYLLYPPLHGANGYDFHFLSIGAVLVLYCVDFLDEGRNRRLAIAATLALCAREDIGLVLVCVALYDLVAGRRRRAAIILGAVSAVYVVTVKCLLMPRFGSWWFSEMYRGLYAEDDPSSAGIVKTLVTNPSYVLRTIAAPEKLTYVLQVLLPVAFLSVRRAANITLLLPAIALTLLTTDYAPAVDIGFQYSGYWYAVLLPAACFTLARMPSTPPGVIRRHAALATAVVATIVCSATWGAIPPSGRFHAGFGTTFFRPVSAQARKKAADLAELAALIPPDKSIAVSEHELPHVSQRADCYTLRLGYGDADYILHSVPGNADDLAQADRAKRTGLYLPVAAREGLELLERRR